MGGNVRWAWLMLLITHLSPPPSQFLTLGGINGGGWRRGWPQLPTFSVCDGAGAHAHVATAWLAAGAFLGYDVGSEKLIRPLRIYSASILISHVEEKGKKKQEIGRD